MAVRDEIKQLLDDGYNALPTIIMDERGLPQLGGGGDAHLVNRYYWPIIQAQTTAIQRLAAEVDALRNT